MRSELTAHLMVGLGLFGGYGLAWGVWTSTRSHDGMLSALLGMAFVWSLTLMLRFALPDRR